MAKQLLMKIHAKYEPSFCISLQVIVIPHYSYHSVENLRYCCQIMQNMRLIKRKLVKIMVGYRSLASQIQYQEAE